MSAPATTVAGVSFVPIGGTAVFRPGEPPREGVVEFTDARRSVALPMRAALPLLAKAHAREDLHPSVALLTGAALLGMRLVAAGRFEPSPSGTSWRLSALDAGDEDRVVMLARSRSYDGLDHTAAEGLVRMVLAAVVDAMPRAAPRPQDAPSRPDRPPFAERLRARIEAHDPAGPLARPHLVDLSLRVEADEEELVAGAVRLVLQVHEQGDPLHVCDAARLWEDDGTPHGFGDRARTHALIALRAAAEAWVVLDRLLELPVPDQITLDTDEILDLLERGVEALATRDVDVLWPRSLGRDLTSRAVLDTEGSPGTSGPRESPLNEPVLGLARMFSFRWQVALHGEPLSDDDMRVLAAAASPVVKLRGGWTVVHPALARRARRRLIATVGAGAAVATALTGRSDLPELDETPAGEQVVVGASLLRVRERLAALRPDGSGPPAVPVPDGLAAQLRDYQHDGLAWLAELTSLGLGACLADDMGLGKTLQLIALHLHRHEVDPGSGPTLVVCPASLLGNWEAELARFAPGVAVRRHHAGRRSLAELGPGVVVTTYATMRRSRALASVDWGLVVADEAQHVKNARSATAQALRSIGSGARVALTGTPVENELSDLWAILDWVTPGLLGSRQAFRRVWAAPIESGLEPSRAAVRRPDRAVPAAADQVRPRGGARAAGADRDRPPAEPHPGADRALRGLRP